MRELTLVELGVVSGGSAQGAAMNFLTGWITGHAADSAFDSGAKLIDAGIKELQSFVEKYNKENPVKLTQKDIEALEKVLEEAGEEKDKAATDYCGCGYSD